MFYVTLPFKVAAHLFAARMDPRASASADRAPAGVAAESMADEEQITIGGRPYRIRGVALRMVLDVIELQSALNSPRFQGTVTYHIGQGNVKPVIDAQAI